MHLNVFFSNILSGQTIVCDCIYFMYIYSRGCRCGWARCWSLAPSGQVPLHDPVWISTSSSSVQVNTYRYCPLHPLQPLTQFSISLHRVYRYFTQSVRVYKRSSSLFSVSYHVNRHFIRYSSWYSAHIKTSSRLSDKLASPTNQGTFILCSTGSSLLCSYLPLYESLLTSFV